MTNNEIPSHKNIGKYISTPRCINMVTKDVNYKRVGHQSAATGGAWRICPTSREPSLKGRFVAKHVYSRGQTEHQLEGRSWLICRTRTEHANITLVVTLGNTLRKTVSSSASSVGDHDKCYLCIATEAEKSKVYSTVIDFGYKIRERKIKEYSLILLFHFKRFLCKCTDKKKSLPNRL